MSQVVQAKCPHCKNVLRIPAEWLAQSMRCKFCKNTFQARGKSPVSASANVAASAPSAPAARTNDAILVSKPASPVMAAGAGPAPRMGSGNPFDFPEEPGEAAAPSSSGPRHKGGDSLLLVMTFFFLFLLGASGAGFVVHKVLTTPAPLWPDANAVVKNDDKPEPPHPAVKIVPKEIDSPKGKPVPPKGKETSLPATKDPLKKQAPPKKEVTIDPPKKKVVVKTPFSNDPFPRRALLISVHSYLMFNTVHYGSGQDTSSKRAYPGSSTGVLRDRLTRPPMNFPATQVVELSDGAPEIKGAKAHSTQKSVLEAAIKDFVDTSRAQDRIVLLFAGHAAYLDEGKKAYLIPSDGDLDQPDSLVPLNWVYDQMARCKAQQKILILDVFRYSPSRGFELPGAGEGDEGTMPDGFDKELLNPPAGVNLWSSCVKDQSAVELDKGSAFLQALCQAMQGGSETTGISTPTQPIPVEMLLPKVNQRLKELLAPGKRTQLSRLTGKSMEGGVKFDPMEPLPAQLVLKAPSVPGGTAAGIAQVENILGEMAVLPPVRDTRANNTGLLRAQNLPAFAASKLDEYKQDGYQSIGELQARYKANNEAYAKEFPLRAAYLEALDKLQQSAKLRMREELSSPVDPKRKAQFLQEQKPLGDSIFFLQQTLAQIKEAAAQRDKEPSKRWQANFDFMQARLQSRLIYLFEYNFTLGQIRADNLPELTAGQSGWRIGTDKKISIKGEPTVKELRSETSKLWKSIQKNYPGTPYAVIARRESMISLGLQWRPRSD